MVAVEWSSRKNENDNLGKFGMGSTSTLDNIGQSSAAGAGAVVGV
jgi:hypothetical protein